MKSLIKLVRAEDGPTAVEYAVLLAGIVAVCIAAITLVGGETANFWSNNQQELQNAFSGS